MKRKLCIIKFYFQINILNTIEKIIIIIIHIYYRNLENKKKVLHPNPKIKKFLKKLKIEKLLRKLVIMSQLI